jgi:hypothetical protein
MKMNKNAFHQLFEITTNIEGIINEEIIDVNQEDTIITAIESFKELFPDRAAYIIDAQLVSGRGSDDLTVLLIGDKPENLKKAFKVAFNILTRNQRYIFNRTPDVLGMIKHEKQMRTTK